MSNFSDTKIPRTKDKRHQTPSKFSKQVPEQRNIYHCVCSKRQITIEPSSFPRRSCDPYHHWESWVILNLKVLKFDFSFSCPINVWPRTFDHKRCLTWYSCELKNSLN
ncbi:hypothetical protein ACFXTH_011720 [Malus domestica]